ncbi:MAG: Gfo/Idh/MocA family oxidoreductase [Verrucomicrobia bacterium]|nr:Gfo/Idh/MocA family oxidoreductase [Verrucomicrobiota bacterium]MCF7707850.1 Gfo/Idh/MocA family oxidoreductase [Verrucomicrobiota bacterium]
MKTVRFGIIGLGNMGKYHADYLSKQKVTRAELTAVSDAVPKNLERFKHLKTFENPEDLINSGEVDAVIIATPHYFHTSLGIKALNKGLHVLVEKPISVHKADCERLIAAHSNDEQAFSAMFQLRTDPKFKKVKSIIDNGELGEIVRVNWIITDWYRTEAYYASGGWRATWKGEGGGVLLNQCPHNLDLMIWLFGAPSRVRGFCQLGRFHNIEVEDNVTAFLEYPNGATGLFVTSTGEAPGTNRLEIAGDRGKLVLENGRLLFTRNEVPMLEFSRNARTGFASPDVWNIEIPIPSTGPRHEEITQNFIDSIIDGTPLIAPAEEGIHSVELANTILFSSLQNKSIEMPLDGKAFEEKLNQLIAESKFEKKVVEVSDEDFTQSFKT